MNLRELPITYSHAGMCGERIAHTGDGIIPRTALLTLLRCSSSIFGGSERMKVTSSPAVRFDCIPVCKACRDANACVKADRVRVSETIRTRRIKNPHAGTVVLPCGCFGLPWPLVHKLGENFDSIFCDRHGWMKLTKVSKKRMLESANKFAGITLQKTLFPDEPPF